VLKFGKHCYEYHHVQARRMLRNSVVRSINTLKLSPNRELGVERTECP
jgi:hypothetical protein